MSKSRSPLTAALALCAVALISSTACRVSRSPSPSGSSAPAAAARDATTAAGQLTAWLAAFNSADQAALAAYHQQSFPYQAASHDVANLERESGLRKSTGGYDLQKTEGATPTTVTAILKERNARKFVRAAMEVDAAPPHRVVRFQFDPIGIPDDFMSVEERARATLDDAKRRRLIEGIVQEMQAHYIFPKVADQMIAALREHLARGDYDKITRSDAFTTAVLRDLRDVSHDVHIRFTFTPGRPEGLGLTELRRRNFGFGPIERLPGNVARLAITAFYPADHEEARDAIAGFMTQVADADALLIDLRENHGGQPETVALVASYLFDAPVRLNDIFRRDDRSTQEFWTLREVPGRRFGGKKPVYVLTSKQTISAGEGLAYDLQSLRRARLVGETTAGGAHPAGFSDLEDGYKIAVPWGRAVNPITKTNWERVGVVPEVPVPETAALEKARLLAVQEILAMARPSAPPRAP